MRASGIGLAMGLAVGCGSNANKCPGASANNNCADIDASAPGACRSNNDCSSPTAVCDLGGTQTCVQCTRADANAYRGTTPVCGGTTCEACDAHRDCGTAACLPDGSCAAAADVAYVNPTGTVNNVCTQAMPRTQVSNALATGRRYVRMTGATNAASVVTVQQGRVVTFLADPGAGLMGWTGRAEFHPSAHDGRAFFTQPAHLAGDIRAHATETVNNV